jgi:homoserine dehydrogenase
MADKIKVAILGLGNIGQEFAEHLLERIQEGGMPIEIVGVAHRHKDTPVMLGFQQNGVPVFEDALDITSLGEAVDIIFDLTGNAETRQGLRERLQQTGNRHSVIAPETFARLLWCFFDTDNTVLAAASGGY